MTTRSGRFVADINVAMAKHYIDNLREEVKKGIYGRLKQGIYPFNAPLGYINKGGGKLKE
jgi:DNA invertase Pin-like site-specific DNA recombinase